MKTTRQTTKIIVAGATASLALAAPLSAQMNQAPPMPGKSGIMGMGGGMMGGGMMGM